MTDLEQIKAAVAETLRAAGMNAVTEYEPGMAQAYSEAVAAVGLAEAESGTLGYQSYLGEELDEKTGAVVERYARRMEATLSLDIYAPKSAGAAEAERAMERAMEILTRGLPAGLKVSKAVWEKVCWDELSGMYLRRGTLKCHALLIAERSQEESGLILDFILKGVMSD
ncbi:MAG: hypothetical protein ACI3W8_05770 [Oscillospiraceae bacterium]